MTKSTDGTTHIGWTNYVFNPWQNVSAGWENGAHKLIDWTQWRKFITFNSRAEKEGVRHRVLVSTRVDVFEDSDRPIVNNHHQVGYMFEGCLIKWISKNATVYDAKATLTFLRKELFKLIDETPWLDWMLLTNRPENIPKMWPHIGFPSSGVIPGSLGRRVQLSNTMLGVRVSNQNQAAERVPKLLQCLGFSAGLFVVADPMTGPIDLTAVDNHDGTCPNLFDGNPLYVGDIGGEYAWSPRGFIRFVAARGQACKNTNANTRSPLHPSWVRFLRDQCHAAKIPFHFDGWGDWYPIHGTGLPLADDEESDHPWAWIDAEGNASDKPSRGALLMINVGSETSGKTLDGREWTELPPGGTHVR